MSEMRKVPISKLNPAPYNPRVELKPEDKEYQAIKNSIESFGYLDPIVWNERTGNIVSGHQRYQILKDKGETELEVMVVDFDMDKEKACNLAMNKAVGLWDDDKLNELLEEMKETPWNMEDFGFENLSFNWDGISDPNEDNYDEPKKDMLECPVCHHIDTPAHFLKRAGEAEEE